MWSVDHGSQDTEVNIASFKLYRVTGESQVDFNVAPNEFTATAWILVRNATLEIRDHIAYLRPID